MSNQDKVRLNKAISAHFTSHESNRAYTLKEADLTQTEPTIHRCKYSLSLYSNHYHKNILCPDLFTFICIF